MLRLEHGLKINIVLIDINSRNYSRELIKLYVMIYALLCMLYFNTNFKQKNLTLIFKNTLKKYILVFSLHIMENF